MHVVVALGDDVALGVAVEAEDLFGGGPAGAAFLGVEGQFVDVVVAHGVAEFSLDQCLRVPPL